MWINQKVIMSILLIIRKYPDFIFHRTGFIAMSFTIAVCQMSFHAEWGHSPVQASSDILIPFSQ